MNALLQGRYEIIQTLSAGGFGETSIAVDRQLPSQRKVVIKKLKPQPQLDEHMRQIVRERFEREAAVLEALSEVCRHVPKLYAFFSEAGDHYLVQEFIEGWTLGQFVRAQGRLDEAQTRQLLTSLLQALHEIHGQNIIHRDIKPDNILVCASTGQPVLIDFGGVKEIVTTLLDAHGTPQNPSIIIRSQGYTSPEQGRGLPVFASDLYSLAMTMIFALTGREPSSLNDLASGELRWHQHIGKLSQPLTESLERAIRYDYRERFKNAQEMLDALNIAPAPVKPQPQSEPIKASVAVAPTTILYPAPPKPQPHIEVTQQPKSFLPARTPQRADTPKSLEASALTTNQTIPSGMRLYPSLRSKAFLTIIFGITALGGYLAVTSSSKPWDMIGGYFALALCGPLAILWALPDSMFLELDEEGFVTRTLFFDKRSQWSDIRSFDVENPSFIRKMVSIKYEAKPAALLPDTYGKSAEDLAHLMNDYLARYASGNVLDIAPAPPHVPVEPKSQPQAGVQSQPVTPVPKKPIAQPGGLPKPLKASVQWVLAGVLVGGMLYSKPYLKSVINNWFAKKTVQQEVTEFTETINGEKLEMVVLPGGSFQMGSPNNEVGRGDNEGPQHTVKVESFAIGKYEITQAQWQAVMDKNPSYFKRKSLPVENVSWNDAQTFCKKLSQLTGEKYRLPSEAEWEYACRADTTSPYAGEVEAMAWYGDNSGAQRIDSIAILNEVGEVGKDVDKSVDKYLARLEKNGNQTHVVGQKLPNKFRLFDMHGNVWEWCEDVSHDSYHGTPVDGSAWLTGGEAQYRVLRGGSWGNPKAVVRSALRIGRSPDLTRKTIGLRVVTSAFRQYTVPDSGLDSGMR